jgi:hypothetical protein
VATCLFLCGRQAVPGCATVVGNSFTLRCRRGRTPATTGASAVVNSQTKLSTQDNEENKVLNRGLHRFRSGSSPAANVCRLTWALNVERSSFASLRRDEVSACSRKLSDVERFPAYALRPLALCLMSDVRPRFFRPSRLRPQAGERRELSLILIEREKIRSSEGKRRSHMKEIHGAMSAFGGPLG